MQREAADEDVDRRQLAEDADARGIDADLLVRFAQRRLRQRLAGIGGAARQADLAGVAAQAAGATVSGIEGPRARIEQQQPAAMRASLGKLARLPAASRGGVGMKRSCASSPGSVPASRSRSVFSRIARFIAWRAAAPSPAAPASRDRPAGRR
jgi:hypothetical protein